MAPRSQEPPAKKVARSTLNKEFYTEYKVEKDGVIYSASFIKTNESMLKDNIVKELHDNGYKVLSVIRHRHKKYGDKEEIKLLEVIPKKYEVTFRIKIDNIKYKKCFIIESNDANKVLDLAKQRCKKEFSKIRSITKMSYKIADENSKEYSEVIKEPKNKIIKEKPENTSEDNLKTTDNKENTYTIVNFSGLPDSLRMTADLGEALDVEGIKNIYTSCNSDEISIKPKNINIMNQSQYSWFRLSLVTDKGSYGPIRILAKSSSNAMIMFEIVMSKDMIKYKKETVREIKMYSLMDENSGKIATFSGDFINKMIENMTEDITEIDK